MKRARNRRDLKIIQVFGFDGDQSGRFGTSDRVSNGTMFVLGGSEGPGIVLGLDLLVLDIDKEELMDRLSHSEKRGGKKEEIFSKDMVSRF